MPSSAVSVAAVLTAAALIVAGRHFGRGSFFPGRGRKPARTTRPQAWLPTARVMTAVLLLLIALFTAAYSAGN